MDKGSLVVMNVNAWELDGKEVLNLYGVGIVWGGGGYARGFNLAMGHWGRDGEGKVNGVHVLEVKCYVYQGADRQFAVDDLVVDFLDDQERETGGR
jgi:hypothetical protein